MRSCLVESYQEPLPVRCRSQMPRFGTDLIRSVPSIPDTHPTLIMCSVGAPRPILLPHDGQRRAREGQGLGEPVPGERTSLSDLRRCARTRTAVHGRPLRRLPQDCPERIAPSLLADSGLCMAGQNGDSSVFFPGDSPVATPRDETAIRRIHSGICAGSQRDQNVRRIPSSNTATLRVFRSYPRYGRGFCHTWARCYQFTQGGNGVTDERRRVSS